MLESSPPGYVQNMLTGSKQLVKVVEDNKFLDDQIFSQADPLGAKVCNPVGEFFLHEVKLQFLR